MNSLKQGFLVAVFLVTFLTLAAQEKNGNVHLKGELRNFATKVLMKNQDPDKILNDIGVEIETDEEGKFEIYFNVDGPTYFKLGRNAMYLEPGYEMRVTVDQNCPEASYFSGKGSGANNYLRFKPFPKGGSFLEAGAIFSKEDDIKTANEKILNRFKSYQYNLLSYPDLSDRFIEFEKVRNYCSLICSYKSFLSYFRYVKRIDKDQTDKYYAENEPYINEQVEKYMQYIPKDPKYLQLEEYKDVIYFLDRKHSDKLPEFAKQYLAYVKLMSKLKYKGPGKEAFELKKETLKYLKDEKYINSINKEFSYFENITPGNKAPDFVMEYTDGKSYKLSDFRGELVVIDIWATWCGSCCYLLPYFEKLADKFKNKPVKFISLSIDKHNRWKQEMKNHKDLSHHYRTDRINLKEYKIQGIPRLFVIDKNGIIVDVFAPRPNSPELEKLIKCNF